MKMVVAGAGLVGCAMAIALKQEGFDVELIEKRSDPRLADLSSGRSINLIVTAKAINLFQNLGIWEDVRKITVPVYGRMMHSIEGELSYQPYGRDDSEFNNSISRGMMNNLLLDKVEDRGIPVSFDTEVSEIDLKSKEIKLEDRAIKYNKLFGCDGAGSPVRAALVKQLGDSADYKVDPLGVDYKEFLMPADSEGKYAIDERSLHIWPRGNHFLMALPNLEGSFTMTLYMPTTWFKDFNTEEKILAYFKENYPDVLEHLPNFTTEYFKNPEGFLGTVRMNPWIFEDSVALLGDAAHAIVPFFGQGMNCGMSDVQFLREQIQTNGNDWSEIMKNYQAHQKPNGDAIAELSLDNFVEMSDRVGDEKFLFKKKIEKILENAFPDTYRSRYGMTVYTLIPYHQALAAGHIQQELLDELIRDVDDADQLDLEKAKSLIDGMLVPWMKKRNLDISKHPVD